MNNMNTEKMEELNENINKLLNSYEENIYALKSIINELSMDELVNLPDMEDSLIQSISKLELIYELHTKLKSNICNIVLVYEEKAKNHMEILKKMSEYGYSLKTSSSSVINGNYIEGMTIESYNLVPLSKRIYTRHLINGVVKDEKM